jgi:outer membrane protein TolC
VSWSVLFFLKKMPNTIRKIYLAVALWVGTTVGILAQQPLTLEAVFAEIRQAHPAQLQANLLNDLARADLLKARGGFDVKLYGDYDNKVFQDKTYFALGEYGAKLPTWYGLELKAGYATASGSFLDPASTLPSTGQAIAGFDWTLGRGLFIDERRADLFQARQGVQLAENERFVQLNDLFFAGAQLYWSWATAREQIRILEQALDRSQVRFEGIRQNYLQGDKPAIDTLEAFILVQNRQFDLLEKQQEAREKAIFLNNFLWGTTPDPRTLDDLLTAPSLPDQPPLPLTEAELETFNTEVRNTHPAIRSTQVKLDMLDVERRYKLENRKPQLDLTYNLLGSGAQFFPENENGVAGALGNNMKWGLNFSYAIPNRKARGDYQKTQVKIASTQAALDQKTREVENKLRAYANDRNLLASQIMLYQSMTDNYRRMLEAEQEKFAIGESTVFLLNTREQKLLEATLKLAKLRGDYEKSRVAVDWARGILR